MTLNAYYKLLAKAVSQKNMLLITSFMSNKELILKLLPSIIVHISSLDASDPNIFSKPPHSLSIFADCLKILSKLLEPMVTVKLGLEEFRDLQNVGLEIFKICLPKISDLFSISNGGLFNIEVRIAMLISLECWYSCLYTRQGGSQHL